MVADHDSDDEISVVGSDISLASTVEEANDEDQEWYVKSIKFEIDRYGVRLYLVEWEGYPLEDASFEPADNIQEDTMETWQETKGDQSMPKFRLSDWKRARLRKWRRKIARQNKRNELRRKRGAEEHAVHSIVAIKDDLSSYEQDDSDDGDWRNPRPKPTPVTGRSVLQDGKGGPTTAVTKPPGVQASAVRASPSKAAASHVARGAQKAKTTKRPGSLSSVPAVFAKKPGSGRLSQDLRPEPTRAKTTGSSGSQAAASNVFAGGKIRKANPKLYDHALDRTKDPKLLKPRHANLIQKASRNAVDSRDPRKLSEPKRVETPKVASGDAGPSPSEDQQPPGVREEESLFLQDTEMTDSPPAINSPPEEEKMEIDRPPTRPKKRVSFNLKETLEPRSAVGPLSVTRKARFGATSSNDVDHSLTFKFESIDLVLGREELNDQARLDFDYVCSANMFASKKEELVATKLAIGSVTNAGDEIYSLLANRLSAESKAVVCVRDTYGILLFPTQNEAWLTMDLCRGAPATMTQGLACIIIRPTSLLVDSLVDPEQGLHARDWQKGLLCPIDTHQLGGVSYPRLTNGSRGLCDVFLAFPPSADEEALFVSRWLKSCNEQCRIGRSNVPGHWKHFTELICEPASRGAVIVHEDVALAIRRFPAIDALLHTSASRFNFFVFSRAVHPQPVVTQRPTEEDSPIGDISLDPVFVSNTAVLVTPSFLLSRPDDAKQLLRWHMNRNTEDQRRFRQPFTLVTSANIREWLVQETIDKAESLRLSMRNIRDPEVAKYFNQPITARLDFIELIADLTRADLTDGIEEAPLYPPSWIPAPESIDDNDEQSLVNFFGWWSLMKMDSYRRFYVLGASEKKEVRIKMVDYRREETPDASGPEWSSTDPNAEPSAESNVPQPATKPEIKSIEPAQAFQGIADVLETCKARYPPNGTIFIFRFPLAGESELLYTARNSCWERWCTLGKMTHHKFPITLMGACYTTDIPGHFNPWVVFWRPVDPHKMEIPRAGELLIWDYTMAEQLRNRGTIYASDLLDAQQGLIRRVKATNPRFSPVEHMPLERVFLGGFNCIPRQPERPLDNTLDFVEDVLRDAGASKAEVPATFWHLLNRGWREVELGPKPAGPKLAGPKPAEPKPVEPPASPERPYVLDPEDQDKKTIFHAPGQGGLIRPSSCRNRLFIEVQEARRRRQPDFDFTFPPTADWYIKQCEEGRGYAHITLNNWDEFSKKHQVGPK